MFRRINRTWVILISMAIGIKVFSLFPQAVEKYYSNGLYPFISGFQRLLFGWIPLSVGDVLYVIAGLWLIYSIVRFFRRVLKRDVSATSLKSSAGRLVVLMLSIYVFFNLAWGLNYNRVPMTDTLGLKLEPYSTANLQKLVQLLVLRLNSFDSSGTVDRQLFNKKRYLFDEVASSYKLAGSDYPFLQYRFRSAKPSIFSYAGNYLGFTGYYNPFSGEAQTNTTVPLFVQPFTSCHEIGHQLGYAKENEANFAGFLSAKSSANPAFQYSLYFDLFSYAIRELNMRDSSQVKIVREQLKPRVRADFRALKAFYAKYENPLEPVIRALYGRYLKANEQPQGMRSYNEVVAMIMAYYRKSGEL